MCWRRCCGWAGASSVSPVRIERSNVLRLASTSCSPATTTRARAAHAGPNCQAHRPEARRSVRPTGARAGGRRAGPASLRPAELLSRALAGGGADGGGDLLARRQVVRGPAAEAARADGPCHVDGYPWPSTAPEPSTGWRRISTCTAPGWSISTRKMLLEPTLAAAEVDDLCRQAVRRLPRDVALYVCLTFFCRCGSASSCRSRTPPTSRSRSTVRPCPSPRA